MTSLIALIKRNVKIFFKDRGLFVSALIAPLIVLGLYVLFLGNTFQSSFENSIPEGIEVSKKLINGFVAGWEVSSIIATSCVTVAFMSNLICVQDKVTGAVADLTITPLKRSTLALSYFISTALTTMAFCLLALGFGFIYIAASGWYLSVGDVFLLILDVIIMSLFGTAFSSIFSAFLKSNGGMSAVGIIVSSVYGFLCGAYIPISEFAVGIKNFITLMPWTYGTSLVRIHAMKGIYSGMIEEGLPAEMVNGMKQGFDFDLTFFGNSVPIGAMYGVILGSTALFIGIFVLISVIKKKDK